jgi:hypothetical protein
VRALLHPDTFHYVCEPAAMRRKPVSDYMAKFSVQFVVAACLVRWEIRLRGTRNRCIERCGNSRSGTNACPHDADPQSQFPKYFSGGVVITTRDGRELVHMEKIQRAAPANARSPATKSPAKFMENRRARDFAPARGTHT